MSKNILVNLLEKYSPSKEEIRSKKRILEFMKNYHNCFERSLASGHITASSWLLNKDLSQALLMHHAKLNIWVQPGGHCDGNADVLSVAIREAQEESGIKNIVPVYDGIFDVDIHLIPENKKEKSHYHYDVRFLLKVNSDEEIIPNKESKELRWIGQDKDQLPTKDASIVRMFYKWLALTSLSLRARGEAIQSSCHYF